MAIRPPRRSALGVDWCEDFTRGRLGVRKNQGVIAEAAPNVIGFDGRWATFPGNVAAYIQYPHTRTIGRTEITVSAWIRDPTAAGAGVVTQVSTVAWDANAEWYLHTDMSIPRIQLSLHTTAGHLNALYDAGVAADYVGVHLLTGTWRQGETIKIYLDAVLMGESAVLAGTIEESNQPITIGRWASANFPFKGGIADPMVDYRCWEQAEIEALHENRLLR